jgi:hypothetical protein
MTMILKIIPVSWLAGAAALLLVFSHGWAYKMGRDHVQEKYDLLEVRQLITIQKLNEAWAEIRRNREIEFMKFDKEVEDVKAEAAKDPNANRPALGIDSVRRLNRIR